MSNSSIIYASIEPIYDIAVPIKHLNLYRYFSNRDADNISAINTYLSRCDIDVYAVNKTASDILFGKKSNSNNSTIDLAVIDYYIKLKGILYGNGLVKGYDGPKFGYIRKTKIHEYLVSFDVNTKFKSEDLMADLLIKTESPIWMKNTRPIELRFINSTFLDTLNENNATTDGTGDANDSDDDNDDWWKK